MPGVNRHKQKGTAKAAKHSGNGGSRSLISDVLPLPEPRFQGRSSSYLLNGNLLVGRPSQETLYDRPIGFALGRGICHTGPLWLKRARVA